MKNIRFKCWVEEEGQKFYGPGPNELVKRIQTEGSLSKAAGQMNMSYKKAWDLVQRLNNHSEKPWVILRKGGQHGGGAEVTPHAVKAMQEYDSLQQKIRELLEQQEDMIRIF
ncbi:winged helix-turn-helix domain-containing protein [Salegentibacter sp. F188]|uniref:Winged helix-turn-helix domain-containing protein n=1 Tax=Autumnicola patrickiae TaxID=3075591 RepID=A0ABU3E569_9FLAO|nr:winged helix-turn-helix domain-containing protein [Salegentibacter sp. F188]MDT0691146.1 winged helix-turn-helix domain-containing protein [Salegentibacter sp. F188]